MTLIASASGRGGSGGAGILPMWTAAFATSGTRRRCQRMRGRRRPLEGWVDVVCGGEDEGEGEGEGKGEG